MGLLGQGAERTVCWNEPYRSRRVVALKQTAPAAVSVLGERVGTTAGVEMRALCAADLPGVLEWFDDSRTRRWVGDRSWPNQALAWSRSEDRIALLAHEDEPLALVDLELRRTHAWMALVVSPDARGTGVGRRVLTAVEDHPAVVRAGSLRVEVHASNLSSLRLFRHYSQVRGLDENGYVQLQKVVTPAC